MSTTKPKLSDDALLAFFRSHPEFRERMASIVGAVANRRETSWRLTRLRSGWSRKCVFWVERRCKAGPMIGSRRRNKKFAFSPACIAKVKKTPVAHEIRRNTVLEPQYRFDNTACGPSFAARRSVLVVVAAFATGDHGFRGRSAFRRG